MIMDDVSVQDVDALAKDDVACEGDFIFEAQKMKTQGSSKEGKPSGLLVFHMERGPKGAYGENLAMQGAHLYPLCTDREAVLHKLHVAYIGTDPGPLIYLYGIGLYAQGLG